MRDKTHNEQIERWAAFIKNKPQEEWRPKFNEFINAQFLLARKFYKNLEKSEKGREILENLRKKRLKMRVREREVENKGEEKSDIVLRSK